MAYEQRDNSGALFRNDKKGNDKAPDYKGNAKVSGVTLELAAWLQTSQKGTKYMSLKFQEPRQRDDDPPAQSATADDPLDDSIPF